MGIGDDPRASLATVVAFRQLADQLERAATKAALDQKWTRSQVAAVLAPGRLGLSPARLRATADEALSSDPGTGR